MSDETVQNQPTGRSKDEIALDMMKFIAVETGYGKGAPQTGFSGKTQQGKSPEEYAEALIQLFERCRQVVSKQPS
jgi:hypothetical protein